MALPIEDRKLTTTTAASSALHPAQGNEVEKKKAPKVTKPPKLEGPFIEARKSAADGEKEISKTAKKTSSSDDPMHPVLIGGLEAVNSGKKAVEDGAKSIGTKLKKVAAPIVEPYTREVEEARKEVGEARKGAGKAWHDLLNPSSDKDVREVRENDTLSDGQRKVLTAWEMAQSTVENLDKLDGAVTKWGLEKLEGAGEQALHNPMFNMYKEAGKGAFELGKGIGGWVQDRAEGAGKGAVKASKTLDRTDKEIEARSKAQDAENAKEMSESTSGFGNNTDNWAEIAEVRDNDTLSDGQRKVLLAWEYGENSVQTAGSFLSDVGDVTGEYFEAEAENFVTDVKNIGSSAAGTFEAAGDFVGSIFD